MADLLRVMITDEDLDSRVSARRALQRAQLEVVGETGYGTDAVSLGLKASPDLVLISVEEPAARALETAESLANALPDTPIIMYSSVNTPEAIRRAMVFGARDYLFKPLDGARVREAILTALSQEERRQMRRAGQMADEAGRGTVITVTGAKGGVGKSIVAVNLATALRQETGRATVVIDADTHFGDVSTLFDVQPEHSIINVLRGLDSLDRNGLRTVVTPHSSGVEVLAGPGDDEEGWEVCSPQDLSRIIEAFAQVYDFVIVDTGGSFDRHVRAAIDASTLTVIVTSSDVSAVRDTARAIRRLDRWGIDSERYRLVLNRNTRADGISREELAAAVGVDVFWEIPNDRSVPASVQVGQPLVLLAGRSPAASSIEGLAKAIAGTQSSAAARSNAPLWRRVLPRKGAERHESHLDTPPQPARPVH